MIANFIFIWLLLGMEALLFVFHPTQCLFVLAVQIFVGIPTTAFLIFIVFKTIRWEEFP